MVYNQNSAVIDRRNTKTGALTMVLGMDVGNSNIVFCVFEQDNIVSLGRTITDTKKSGKYYTECILKLLDENGIEPKQIKDAVISSVVPNVNDALIAAAKCLFGANALLIDGDTTTGLTIKGAYPEQLGNDVIVGCVAAMQNTALPLVVVDMGTATTFAVVNKDRSYIGGMIIPGPRLLAQSLSDNTSQLDNVVLEAPDGLLGQNTSERIKNGIIFGNASLIDGVISKIEMELGEMPSVVATGGFMPLILPHCKRSMVYDEMLIPRGLSIIYNMNRSI